LLTCNDFRVRAAKLEIDRFRPTASVGDSAPGVG
jgi:hypothetical protein